MSAHHIHQHRLHQQSPKAQSKVPTSKPNKKKENRRNSNTAARTRHGRQGIPQRTTSEVRRHSHTLRMQSRASKQNDRRSGQARDPALSALQQPRKRTGSRSVSNPRTRQQAAPYRPSRSKPQRRSRTFRAALPPALNHSPCGKC